jgi:hypothetical protein
MPHFAVDKALLIPERPDFCRRVTGTVGQVWSQLAAFKLSLTSKEAIERNRNVKIRPTRDSLSVDVLQKG